MNEQLLDELRGLAAFTLAVILEPRILAEHGETFCDVSGDLDGCLQRVNETLGPWQDHLPIGLYSAMRALGYQVKR